MAHLNKTPDLANLQDLANLIRKSQQNKKNIMKIIAFAGSNSKNSINHQLASYAGSLVKGSEIIKLSDYDIPMYSIDAEEATGIPNRVKELDQKLAQADALIISVAEHNGNITAFFKNILDWLSRNNRHFLDHKKVVILSTSPGQGGGASALSITEKTLPYFGATVVSTLSIPSFHKSMKNGILVSEIESAIKKALQEIV